MSPWAASKDTRTLLLSTRKSVRIHFLRCHNLPGNSPGPCGTELRAGWQTLPGQRRGKPGDSARRARATRLVSRGNRKSLARR